MHDDRIWNMQGQCRNKQKLRIGLNRPFKNFQFKTADLHATETYRKGREEKITCKFKQELLRHIWNIFLIYKADDEWGGE